MPELPEVETVVRVLRPALVGREIADVWSDWPRALEPGLRTMRRMLVGRCIKSLSRRGKYIVIGLGAPGTSGSGELTLLIHLRMSGRLVVASSPSSRPRDTTHVHWRLQFSGGDCLLFDDARKFGRVIVTRNPAKILEKLGPEPLSAEFTEARLAERIGGLSRRVKPALLDQSIIAGLGNIYTDEALHRAGLHPLRRCDSLHDAECARLHHAIREVLEVGIHNHGASIDWVYPGGSMQEQFLVYGRTGEPCRACATAITRTVVGQRGTHYCPKCQPTQPTKVRSGPKHAPS